jgi:uncharacterized membrane protein
MKIIDDTLKSPNGKWSRKSLTSFFAFWIGLALGAFIVISDYFLKEEVNRYAIDVFQTLMLLVGATLGLTVWDKQTMYKNDSKTENNE